MSTGDDTKKIEKPWCIYKGVLFFPQGVVKIEEESDTTARVRYSEGQLYPLETWDKEYLERFETIEEAVEKFIKDTQDYKREGIIKIKFPPAFTKEDSV